MSVELERSKEKIYFTEMELDDELVHISTLTIHNAGTIEVRIRGLYVEKDGNATFVTDPSSYMDTHIPPNDNLTLNVEPDTLFEQVNIIAATERGTTTVEYEPYLIFKTTELKGNPSELTIGPLLLKFTDFKWRKTINGGLDPNDIWHDGWIINQSTQCAWKISVKNIDNRTTSILLNNYTSFNTITADGPANSLNWYLSTPTQELSFNETREITFMFYGWNDDRLVSIYSTKCSAKVFLTCFGLFKWADGRPDSYYAQTIPFEAIFITQK